jgi:hypothetical protein
VTAWKDFEGLAGCFAAIGWIILLAEVAPAERAWLGGAGYSLGFVLSKSNWELVERWWCHLGRVSMCEV